MKTKNEFIKKAFEKFWTLYDKKTARALCEKIFEKLSLKEIVLIIEHVPKYVASTPNKKYRLNPSTYLNQRRWEDEYLPNDESSVDDDPFTKIMNEKLKNLKS